MKIKNILISQPKPGTEKSPYHKITEQYKINVEFNPFVKIEHIPYSEVKLSKIDFNNFEAFIFYSKIAVDHFFQTCKEAKIKPKYEWKYFCTNEAIALYLQKHIIYRKRKIFFGNSSLSGLMEQIRKFPDDNYLISLSEIHKSEIPNALAAENIKYSEAILFRTVGANMRNIIADINKYDVLLFFSPVGMRSLRENFPSFVQGDKIIGVLGDNTARTAEELGFRIDIKVPCPEFTSMPDALENFLNIQHNCK